MTNTKLQFTIRERGWQSKAVEFLIVSVASMIACIVPQHAFAEDDEPTAIAIATIDRTGPVDFNAEILPFLRTSCLACHNATDAESDLVLESAALLRKGGGSGPAVVPGKSTESHLLQLASFQEEPVMPPVDNDAGAKPLTPEQLGLLKLWIDQGALDGKVSTGADIAFRPLPRQVDPILAAAISADRRLAACSRGNRLFTYETDSGRLLQELIDPELRFNSTDQPANTAHLDLVQTIAFDPTGTWLASGGFRNVKLWRRQESSELRRVTLSAQPTCLAVSDNGSLAAVGYANGSIDVVDVATGAVSSTLTGHAGPVHDVCIPADGQSVPYIASTGEDRTIRLWQTADGKQVTSWEVPSAAHALAATSNPVRLISGHDDNLIRVWALAGNDAENTAKLEREIGGHSGPVTSLATVASQPALVVSGSADGTVRSWNVQDGQQVKQFNHESPVLSVAVLGDGKRAVSTGENRQARLWNLEDGQRVAEIQGDYRSASQLASIDRGMQLLRDEIGSTKGRIGEFEKQQASRGEEVKKAQEATAAAEKELGEKQQVAKDSQQQKEAIGQTYKAAEAALAATGTLLESVAEKRKTVGESGNQLDQGLQQTRAAAGTASNDAVSNKLNEVSQLLQQFRDQQNQTLEQLAGKLDELRGAAQQQLDETKKKMEEADKKLKEAENASQDAQRKLDQAKLNVDQRERDHQRATDDLAAAQTELAGYEGRLQDRETQRKEIAEQYEQSKTKQLASRFSPANDRLAVAAESGQIFLYDAITGAASDALDAQQTGAIELAWSNDTLVSVGTDQQLVVWNVRPAWELVRTLGGMDQASPLVDRVLALDFSSDGRLLAAGSGEPSRSGVISIWNVEDGSLVRAIDEAHSDTVFSLEFSPDDQFIASAAADRMAKVFRVEDGAFVRGFEGHTHHVLDVAWQANGKSLATAGADKVIKIWDAQTGEQRRTIGGIGKEVTSVAYVGIGGTIVSSSGDTNIRVHNTGDGNVIRTMSGGGDFVYAAAVSEDGKRVVSGGVKSVFQVWNAENGELLHALATPPPTETQ